MKIEEILKNYIIGRYGSLRAFALKADIAYTTLVTILQRGIDKSSITSIKKICDTLSISADKLSEGKIVTTVHLIEPKEPVIDLNDLVSQYKWTIRNNPVNINGHELSEKEIETISTALDIGLEMIKQNNRS